MTLNILGGRDHKPHTIPKCAAALGLRGNRCWDDTPGALIPLHCWAVVIRQAILENLPKVRQAAIADLELSYVLHFRGGTWKEGSRHRNLPSLSDNYAAASDKGR